MNEKQAEVFSELAWKDEPSLLNIMKGKWLTITLRGELLEGGRKGFV